MSEEVQAPEVQGTEDAQVDSTVITTVEDRARDQGWRPQEEFDGDKSKWVSAETFVAKGELISKIESIGKELKNTKKAMSMLQDHHTKVKEAEFTRAVNFLKQQKKQAYETGDVDKIMDIDEQLANVKETQKQQTQMAAKEREEGNEPNPNFVSWVDNNKWYNTDTEMRETADALGLSYAKVHADKSPEDVLEYVSKKIKSAYPEKFTNQNRSRPSAVEGAGNSARGGDSGDTTNTSGMTEDEVRVMNTFVRQGIMTKQEYIKELKSIKGAR